MALLQSHFQWPRRGTINPFFELLSMPTPHYTLKLNSGGYSESNYSTSTLVLARKCKIGYPYGFLLRLWPSSWALSSVPRHTCQSPLETSFSLICSVATTPWRETGTSRERDSSDLLWAPTLWLNSDAARLPGHTWCNFPETFPAGV